MAKLISVISPAYNEEDCVQELACRLKAVAASLADRYDFEFIIIENGSRDRTLELLMEIHKADPRFKIITFSRNFGIESALTAGLRTASGDAAIIMCADLQDPPELIPDLVRKWEDGFQNVYGIITARHDEGALRKFLTRRFYNLINRVSEQPIPSNVSDFRLVDRKLYQTVSQFTEHGRMLRTIWAWAGFRSIGVPHERPPRPGGRSTYNTFGAIGFALRAIASSSTVPLKIIPWIGVGLSSFSFVLLLGFVIRWVAAAVPFNGFGTIVALLLLLFGLLFMILGIITEYIGLIFEETRNRPLFIVESTTGFDRHDAIVFDEMRMQQ